MISDVNEPGIAPKQRRRLTSQDMNDIAKLVATRKCTETEACLMLDIPIRQWNCWKSRAKQSAKFESIIARIRGNYMAGLVDSIERAGDDKEIQCTCQRQVPIIKSGDWRAKAWIAEKIDTRFAPQQINQAPQVTVQIGIIHEQLKRVIGFNDIKEIEQPKIKMPVRRTVDV